MRIDYVEAALIALLQAKMTAAFGAPVQVDSLGSKDFNEQGTLILKPPAIRVQFGGAEYDPLHDNQRLTYEAGVPFDILCFESSLRSKADERKQTLALVAIAQNQLAGARLTLQDESRTQPLTMKGVSLVVVESNVVDQAFAITVLVQGVAQFDGSNAQTPGGGV